MRIAIIGGGIAGLAAAYELEKARAAGAAVEYTLFEERPRLGGSLASEIVDGAVLERGPDSFLTEKPAAAELCRELGLGGELIPRTTPRARRILWSRNRLVALPDGLMFLVPTKLVPTALTRLFSVPTKVRMALELLHPPRPSEGDESVAALVERHFGQEAVDRLADPLLSGIYGGDSTQLSAHTVLPRLVEMETKYGSLTRGMLAAHRKMRALAKNSSKTQNRGAAPFLRRCAAACTLVDAITARLDPGSVRTGTAVSGMEKTSQGWKVQAGGVSGAFDALIVASPAWAAGELLDAGGCGVGRGARRHSLLFFDHCEPGLRRSQARPAARWIRISGSGSRGPRDAGLHLCASQVFGPHAAGEGRVSRISGRHEARGSARRDRRRPWWQLCAARCARFWARRLLARRLSRSLRR